MASGSRRAVVTAIVGNGTLTVLKFAVALPAQSAALMNEAVHSLMDTLNQIFLLIGLVQGERRADARYAFGHGQKKYLWNLWSAIGLFSIGCGLGLAHAWHAWHGLGENPARSEFTLGSFSIDLVWLAGVVLVVALVVEAYVLRIVWIEFCRRAREQGISVWKKLFRPTDPTLLAVLLEDAIAVIGVLLAGFGIALTRVTGNGIWDVGFSIAIALMLGVTAIILGAINMRLLTDVRDREAEAIFDTISKAHREIERYHDLRSIVVDEANTVLVAEVELREEAVLAGLRQRISQHEASLLATLPQSRRDDALLREYVADRAAVQATLERTEELIDELEQLLRERCPRVSHITLEVQGIIPDRPLDAAEDISQPEF
ncbi:MAG TPA: cation diffusion facilitator family transporter [Gammaproteobacteria bacterium]|nr:cation diffusion facilitator family transporter [Acidiferrobacteraceae bacterium]MDP6397678.1 cation diffusion facilitator family transporter [Arenicellales bacterium]HCX88541.1 cation diffusion facilitator family transporter [Gammaproteobacteria bacterium]MDP6551433.1 cation diffusion facilitator family transporter [Arenicellales bacterium]MDP6790496.1 cation diffusion facilitator family transporter [Arenicellales bacterium]|tara:strand:+ start:15992 stop:17113 length:1122 start_codon:yes stop_codon:yes gene_type:complete